MVKLCRACGYINRDDALECEECHSLFDDKLNSLVNNDIIEDKIEENNDSNEYQPSEIISISDILKQNNEDVISDQNQYVPDDTTNITINNTNENVFNDYNKEDNSPQYVSDFLYSKNGDSDSYTLDENQFIGDPNQIEEFDETSDDSNTVSDFLYDSNQNNSSYESTSSIDINDDFDFTSVSDFLYGNSQATDNNTNDYSNKIGLEDDFDAEEDVTNILYNNHNINTNEIIDESKIETFDDDLINTNEVRPFDIIYSDSQEKNVSNFLYDEDSNAIEETTTENNILDETAVNENDILEEISPFVQEMSNVEVYEPADIDESYVYNEQASDENEIPEEINELVEETVPISENIDLLSPADAEENFDVLSNDNSNIKSFDTLSDDVLESKDVLEETINDNVTILSDEEINEEVDKELKDATYMQGLDISNILSYGNEEEANQTDSTVETENEQDNTQTSTKTGLLDTLKQIFSLSSSSSKELSKEELDKEYNNGTNDSNNENFDDSNIGPLENLNSSKPSTPKPSGFTNIKPMEIRRKSVDNINKAVKTSDDEELANAFEVFENVGSYKKEKEEAPQTVIYDDLSSINKVNTEEETNQTAIPSKEDKKSKKSKLIKGKKQIIEKPLSRKQTIIRRSIALSFAVAAIIIAIVVISRVNKEKELNAYAARLAANNDVSYTYLYNSLLEKGYSEEESFKAIESLNIDFADNALNIIYTVAQDSNKLSTKEEVKNILVGKGFANSEIEKAMSIVDWSKFLNIYIDACVAKIKELDKNTIIKSIQDAGYTTTEIEYIKKNSDWTKLAKKNLDSYLNNEEDTLHTKEEAKIYLVEKGYSDQDIDNTFKNYEWDVYAYQYLTKYLEQKEEAGTTIESSRITYTQILKDAKFDEEEIELVMGRFDFASYAKSKIDTTISEGSNFVDKNKVKESLEKEGYTKEEIESALKETDWKTTAIDSLKSLDNRKLSKKEMIQKLTDAGYSDEEIEYVNKNYGWTEQAENYLAFIRLEKKNGNEEHLRSLLTDSGYTTEEINKLIEKVDKNLDYFKNAAKEDIEDISSDTGFSRKKVRKYLSELNYGSDEIDAVIKSYAKSWKSIAESFIKSLNINSRSEARKALQNDEFTSEEIESAISSINASSWSQICVDYAKSIYDQEGDDDKCEDYKLYKNNNKNETSIAKALKAVEYSDEEISSALNKVFTIAPCTVN